jgi:hypothetical protein
LNSVLLLCSGWPVLWSSYLYFLCNRDDKCNTMPSFLLHYWLRWGLVLFAIIGLTLQSSWSLPPE